MYQFSSVAQSCPTLCDPMNRSARPPCPSPTTYVYIFIHIFRKRSSPGFACRHPHGGKQPKRPQCRDKQGIWKRCRHWEDGWGWGREMWVSGLAPGGKNWGQGGGKARGEAVWGNSKSKLIYEEQKVGRNGARRMPGGREHLDGATEAGALGRIWSRLSQ